MFSDSFYRIVGTEDLLIIRHNDGPPGNVLWENCAIEKEYFAKRRTYAQRVGILSRKYNIPFDVSLAIGDKDDIYHQFVVQMGQLAISKIPTGIILDLQANIDRRKKSLFEVLGEKLYAEMSVARMGQQNSKRIAKYVAKRCAGKILT